ncbi:hypothetical protein GCM10023322_70420 [Rugosimonospora acidiphila]|uniref:Uncharacterized protein n=1 Tax=Rugosimonospora acidiphila TaxID=556531 RepID=A0ABP9SMN8_9ACTN
MIVPGIGKQSLIRLSAPELRTFLNKVKRSCQCCALRKDERRPESKRRCCARKPRECCESYLSDGTIRYIHRVLRVALQDAILDGLLTHNVAKNLRLTFRYRPRFKPLTADEARAVLKAAKPDGLYALYAVGWRWDCAAVGHWGVGRTSTSTVPRSTSARPSIG